MCRKPMLDFNKHSKNIKAEKAGRHFGFLFGMALFLLATYYVLSKFRVFVFSFKVYFLVLLLAIILYETIVFLIRKKKKK